MFKFLYIVSWIVCFQATISFADQIETKGIEHIESDNTIFQTSELAPRVFEKEFFIDSDIFGQTRNNKTSTFQNNLNLNGTFENLTVGLKNYSENGFIHHSNLSNEAATKLDDNLQISQMLSVEDLLKKQEAAKIELELQEKISQKSLAEHPSKRTFISTTLHQDKSDTTLHRETELINIVKNQGKSEKNAPSPANNQISPSNQEQKQLDLSTTKQKQQNPVVSQSNQHKKVQKPMKIIRSESFITQNSTEFTNTTNKTASSNKTSSYTKISPWKLNNWYSILMIACLGIAVIVGIQISQFIGSVLNEDLLKTLDAISRDTITIAILVIIAGLINYFNLIPFVEFYVNVEAVSLGVLFFGTLWAVLGLFLAALAHLYIREWRSFESEYQKRDAIFRQYEDLYYNSQRSVGLNAELRHRRRQLEFFLMRQEFVTPSFLPIFGEDFSRDDYNFSAYLTKCICKVNQQAFRFDFITFLTIAATTGLSALAYSYIKHLLFKILIASPIVLYLPLRLLARKMTRIYGQLVTVVKSPYDVDLAKFENLRQPQINLEKLSIPTYLSKRFPAHQFRERWFDMSQPNRHVLLYWLHSPGFIIRILHSILVMHVEWLAYFILDLSFGIEKFNSPYYWIGVGIAILASAINLFYTLPHILKLSAITNNIQMLKDKKLRREVCEEKIQQRQKGMQHIYSVLKTIRRQSMNLGKDIHLRLYIVNHVREIFKELRGTNNDKAITYNRLISLAHLCGRDFTEREAMILAHDITCRNSSNISFDEFMEAIEKIFVDVGSSPIEVSKAVIKSLSNTVSSTISSKNLRISLEKLDLFENRDIDVLMHEVKYLPIEHAQHSISSIATLIRDSIEGMPR